MEEGACHELSQFRVCLEHMKINTVSWLVWSKKRNVHVHAREGIGFKCGIQSWLITLHHTIAKSSNVTILFDPDDMKHAGQACFYAQSSALKDWVLNLRKYHDHALSFVHCVKIILKRGTFLCLCSHQALSEYILAEKNLWLDDCTQESHSERLCKGSQHHDTHNPHEHQHEPHKSKFQWKWYIKTPKSPRL